MRTIKYNIPKMHLVPEKFLSTWRPTYYTYFSIVEYTSLFQPISSVVYMTTNTNLRVFFTSISHTKLSFEKVFILFFVDCPLVFEIQTQILASFLPSYNTTSKSDADPKKKCQVDSLLKMTFICKLCSYLRKKKQYTGCFF